MAAYYFLGLLNEEGKNAEVQSAGVYEKATKPLTKEMANEANVIFVMDIEVLTYMKKMFAEDFSEMEKKIVDLDIPDAYWPSGEFQPTWLNKEKRDYYSKMYGDKKFLEILKEKKELLKSYI